MDNRKIKELTDLREKCENKRQEKANLEGKLEQLEKDLDSLGVEDVDELKERQEECEKDLDDIEVEMENIYEDAMEALGE